VIHATGSSPSNTGNLTFFPARRDSFRFDASTDPSLRIVVFVLTGIALVVLSGLALDVLTGDPAFAGLRNNSVIAAP
ncbi:hypothetical protein A2U01_0081790, partial [Trifolium medium]|nr:hypothetical protein [Trifolium medium]